MSVTRTQPYRHLMVLMGNAGIQNKADRFLFASKVLKRKVTSFTRLSTQDVDALVNALHGWTSAQEVRMINGVLNCEAAMTLEMMNNPDRLMISEESVLPNAQSRRNFMSKMNIDINENKYKAREDVSSVLDKALTGLSTSSPTQLAVSEGRWDSWRVIPAPTTSMGLAIGIGGIPRGKIIHLWGMKHAGKSMLSYSIIAEAQKEGIPCILIDAEAAATGDFIEAIGVDVEELNVVRPNDLEELCTMLRRLADSGYLIVVDSIAAAESAAELERNLSKEHARVGGNARLWTSTLSTIRAKMLEHGTTLVLINQVRSNIGGGMYDPDYKPWGSEGIQHHTDISIHINKVNEKNTTLKGQGYRISRCRMDKNRFGEMTTFDLHFKPGFPYNKSIDVVRWCGQEASVGSGVTYSDLAHNVLVAGYAADDNGELTSNKNRFAIRIDPLMMTAIRVDDPDFFDVDIAPLEDWDHVTVTPVDTEKSTYFTLPRSGELSASAWMKDHPMARSVIESRLLDGLKNKSSMISDDR